MQSQFESQQKIAEIGERIMGPSGKYACLILFQYLETYEKSKAIKDMSRRDMILAISRRKILTPKLRADVFHTDHLRLLTRNRNSGNQQPEKLTFDFGVSEDEKFNLLDLSSFVTIALD